MCKAGVAFAAVRGTMAGALLLVMGTALALSAGVAAGRVAPLASVSLVSLQFAYVASDQASQASIAFPAKSGGLVTAARVAAAAATAAAPGTHLSVC